MVEDVQLRHQLFQAPGHWLGKGTISFSESDDRLTFYTRWTVMDGGPNGPECNQEIEIEGFSERMQNAYRVTEVTGSSFAIELINPLIGQVMGEGLISDRIIAWEFRDRTATGFEGYESYELQEDGSYKVHAEYTSSNQLRTVVDGELWRTRGKVTA
jgi:hypothetical protein